MYLSGKQLILFINGRFPKLRPFRFHWCHFLEEKLYFEYPSVEVIVLQNNAHQLCNRHDKIENLEIVYVFIFIFKYFMLENVVIFVLQTKMDELEEHNIEKWRGECVNINLLSGIAT